MCLQVRIILFVIEYNKGNHSLVVDSTSTTPWALSHKKVVNISQNAWLITN